MDFNTPGYIIAILWAALAFSLFANIVLIKKKFIRSRKEGRDQSRINRR
jgi:hypothetical protein